MDQIRSGSTGLKKVCGFSTTNFVGTLYVFFKDLGIYHMDDNILTIVAQVDLTKKPVKTTEDLNTFEDVMKHVFDSRFAAMHSSDESEVEVSDNEAEW